MKEIWKNIKNYNGYYQVSNLGNVKSLRRKRSDSRHFINERLLKPIKHTGGYLCVSLVKDKIIKPYYIHRLVALTFISNSSNKPEVNHKDGIKNHNEATNLEWFTSKENKEHADSELGINVRRTRNPSNVLTEQDITKIKSILKRHTCLKLKSQPFLIYHNNTLVLYI